MTPRERILSAVRHIEPDRVPVDCGAMRSTGIQAIAYGRLKTHIGMGGGHTDVFDVVQQLAEPEDPFLDRFEIDAVNAGRAFNPNGWKDWTLPDGSPCRVPAYVDLKRSEGDWLAYNNEGELLARMLDGTTYFSQTCYPLERSDWLGLLDSIPAQMRRVCWAAMPEPIYEDGLSPANIKRIAAHVGRLRATSDRATMIAYGANLFEWASYLRRMDNFLMDVAIEPANAEKLLDKLVEIHCAGLDRLIPALGDNVDLIQLGDDLGTENGPFFSQEMFRRFFKPRYRILIDYLRRLNPDIIVFLHCCGSIAPLLGDLIEVGVQVINPVQIGAKNMDPVMLKREFGRDVTFWGGGCDTQRVLSRGTVREVRDHVRRNIDIFAPGGGFVFDQVHNILAEVPPENVVAMYDEARQ